MRYVRHGYLEYPEARTRHSATGRLLLDSRRLRHEQPPAQQKLDTSCSRARGAREDTDLMDRKLLESPLEDTHMTKRIATMLTKGLVAATLIGSLAGSAAAQTQTEPNRPATADMDRGRTAPVDTRDDRPNWGLLGLIGLAGLAGLRRRNDAKDYRSDRSDRVGATGNRG
jgi:MYXO-CTERM domain-containing protein